MEVLNPRQLKAETDRRLAAASFPARRLALLHTGIALACSLVMTVISYLLSTQVSNTGGLAGIGMRSVLQSAQSILSTGLSLAMPFWEFGFIAAAMGYARQESVDFKTLTGGFRRFGPILRLLLLYMLLLVAATQIASTVVILSPLGSGMMDMMQTLSENETFLQTGAFPEELLEPLFRAAIPAYVLAVVVFVGVSIPVSYRLRLANYLVLDGENRALLALLTSNRIMKGNCMAFFKLDLSFWWYWVLQAVCGVLAFGDVLLPLVGVKLPMDEQTAMFLFYGLQMLGSLALAWLWRAPVETAYAAAYDELTGEPQMQV